MFAIIINKITVEFEGSLSLVENSPVFSDDINNYSLQFSLPGNSEVNRRAHEFIDLPEAYESSEKEFECVIFADTHFLVGTVISKFQGGNFVDYFKNSGSFYYRIKDKKLSEISFEKTTFETMQAVSYYIQSHLDDSCDRDCSFPVVNNFKIAEKFPVKFLYFDDTVNDNYDGLSPIMPFYHLHFILTSIFEKNGVNISDYVISKNKFLKRLCFSNNYILNEFSIDKTVEAEAVKKIARITGEKDPVVTCTAAHNLINYDLIHIKNALPGIENRIFQIEKIDNVTFKILNEDFGNFGDFTMLFHITSAEIVEVVVGEATINKVKLSLEEELNQMQIDQFIQNGNVQQFDFQGNPFSSGLKYCELVYSEEGDVQKSELYFLHEVAPELLDTFQGNTLYILNCPGSNLGVYENIGILQKLAGFEYAVTEINPANHMPDMTISDFLFDLEKLGIYSFVNNHTVELHHIKDILNDADYIDLSEFTETIRDVENTGIKGYALKMTLDGSDNYTKEKQPFTSIDEKYNIKDPVYSIPMLPIVGSETNDVRLVESEYSYYVFNKSFLNAENNWKFLCLNRLDKTQGDESFSVNSKFSNILTYQSGANAYRARFDVPCNCKTFSDSSLKVNPRLASYYNLNENPFITSDTTDLSGNEIADAQLAIRWDTEKGIYNVLLKEYIEWQTRTRKDCVAKIHWPMAHFANLQLHKKVRIRGVDYLVKSVKYNIDFKAKEITFGDTELAKV